MVDQVMALMSGILAIYGVFTGDYAKILYAIFMLLLLIVLKDDKE